ncbi:predicted protein [Lichtheimia corymbifera JMRC:FSU:9682]|uniref:Uncharacterized protein n=1 Tax=Lichtheimia corymbifera JMRC:FSU:9682 TaxID=1263082 RepID=A0A068SDA1_9FUNG|nr:predicted protein [Lichtheimia corymbifera JMRC:FSU:9682]
MLKKKAELMEADKQAVAERRTKPSILAQASTKFPLMVNSDGSLDEYDIVAVLRDVGIPVPLHELLFYAPGLHQAFLEAVGGKMLGYNHRPGSTRIECPLLSLVPRHNASSV